MELVVMVETAVLIGNGGNGLSSTITGFRVTRAEVVEVHHLEEILVMEVRGGVVVLPEVVLPEVEQ